MSEDNQLEGIAIIGMACRFPGANNLQQFWENLCDAKESIKFFTEEELLASGLSSQQINAPDYIAASPILEDVDKFDAEFFEFSPREARIMDPQQRLLLEVAWEAFEDAGYSPEQKSSSIIGSFTGSGGLVSSYFVNNLRNHPELLGSTGSLEHIGNDKDFLSTRIAYKLNCTGPSINVQTACSTSMVALHLACQSILTQECDMALVGASTVRYPHDCGYRYIKGDILSSDGHCRPFDENAEGTIFGSGVAAVIIKSLKKAIEDKDPIYAVIKSTSINNDGGLKISYTASSVEGQVNAIKKALLKAKVPPESIGYVECHGTGTLMGDPLEVNALYRAFALKNATKSCAIGSVKGNIGHLEQTSGLAGLIKAALIVKHGRIPPSINYSTPNPKIPFDKMPFYVNTTLQNWPNGSGKPRRVCVNSLGLGGTNGFAILEQVLSENLLDKTNVPNLENSPSLEILNLSAKNPAALSLLKKRFHDYLLKNTTVDPSELCYSVNTGRTQFAHRASYLGNSTESLRIAIDADLRLDSADHRPSKSKEVVFMFTGQGSQYPNMAQSLYQSQPIFSAALEECDALLRPYLDVPLLNLLYDAKKQYLLDESTLYAQPALFSLEYALAQLWSSWGIKPSAVMGHSVGEYVAACIAGVFSLPDALGLIAERARLMHDLPQQGGMAVIFSDESTVRELIEQYSNGLVNIAALNTPINTVIAGENSTVHLILQKCQTLGIASSRLNVSNAFHSHMLDPMLPAFTEKVKRIQMNDPVIPWISNLTGDLVHSAPEENYWANHARQPVRFQEGVLLLERLGYRTFLEIGPGNTLLKMGKSFISRDETQWLASLSGDDKNNDQILKTVRQLYLSGFAVDWQSFYPNKIWRMAGLPSYPFQGKRYHLDKEHKKIYLQQIGCQRDGNEPVQGVSMEYMNDGERVFNKVENLLARSIQHPLMGEMKETSDNELILLANFDFEKNRYFDDHRMFNVPVMPTTAGIELALTIGKELLQTDQIAIENLIYERSIILPVDKNEIVCTCKKNDLQHATIVLSGHGTNQNEIYLSADLHINPDTAARSFSLETIKTQCVEEVSGDQFYSAIAKLGLNYGMYFRGVQTLWLGEQKVLSKVRLPDLITDSQNYTVHPAFLDACLHIYPALVDEYMHQAENLRSEKKVYLPIGIERFECLKEVPRQAWIYAEQQEITNNGLLIVNIYVLDNHSQLVAMFKRLTLRQLSLDDLKPAKYVENLYQLSWQKAPNLSAQPHIPADPGLWLVFANSVEKINDLKKELIEQGLNCYWVVLENHHAKIDSNTCIINADNSNHYNDLFQDIFKEEKSPLKGILYFSSTSSTVSRDDAGVDELLLTEQKVCRNALYLAQAMINENFASLPQTSASRIWFISKNGQAIPGENQEIDLIQAELWGMGRTLELEYPNIWGGLIDLDKEDSLSQVLRELDVPSKEQQIVIRGNNRFFPRLVKVRESADGETKSINVKEEASYLITGGLGSLGLCVAKWLVTNHAAKHLILIGRSEGSEAALNIVSELRNKGVLVQIYKTDVTNEAEVNTLFRTIKATHRPLRGVIHCAGGLEDAVVNKMTWDNFVKVTRPKVLGGWLLHHYTKDLDLDFFILFSSILSLMGSPGQINYTAGNAFLDALGTYRRSLGLPTLVMNWGPWGEIGLATHSGNRGEAIWRKRGTEYIKPNEAMRLLDESIHFNLDHAGVTITDWQKFASQFNRLPPFYSALAIASDVNQTKLDEMKNKFLNREPSCALIIEEILSVVIKDLLGIDETIETSRPLNEVGLDSLIAVELINQIEYIFKIRISAMDIIQGASIEMLSEKIDPSLTGRIEKNKATPGEWLVSHKKKPQAQAYLFCFPYAGGGSHVFKTWNDHIAEHIQVVTIHLPGRGTRLNENLPASIGEMAQIVVEQLISYLDKPFAFFGHSMGGLLMYEVTLELKKRGLPLPICLFPSAVVAPHLYAIPNYHEFNDHEFMAVLKKMDFKSTEAIWANEEVRRIMLPIIRADLALAARYPQECSGQYCLNLPIVAFGGTEDSFAEEIAIHSWADYTGAEFNIRMYSGNHFFIETQIQAISNVINEMFELPPVRLDPRDVEQPVN